MLGGGGSIQPGFFDSDREYLEAVGRETFYGWMAGVRYELFRDEEFADLYHRRIGRPSVAPSLLAKALVLQTFDGVADDEAVQRANLDVRWTVALGLPIASRPFAKSTLQEFRARLVVNEGARRLLERSIEQARAAGFGGLTGSERRKARVALDTTAILGRGAVKDTYNLLADGIARVARVLARQRQAGVQAWGREVGLERYVNGGSLKGSEAIDWDDAAARKGFLARVVGDADRVLEMARETLGQVTVGSPEATAIAEATAVLRRVLDQDVERREDGPELRDGVAHDRMVSVHDPEMRHGRKSAAKKFDGHKAAVVVDTDTALITAVAVLPGNAADAAEALPLVDQAEATSRDEIVEVIGDCAYGSGATRQAFAAAGREVTARVPPVRNGRFYPKTDFHIAVEARLATCPAGQTASLAGRRGMVFRFAAELCAACPLRSQCVRGRGGRSVALHPQEALVQAARAAQQRPEFVAIRRRRQVVERRIARLVQLGIRQARYVGRAKTTFQLFLAATVANLTTIAASAARAVSVAAVLPSAAPSAA